MNAHDMLECWGHGKLAKHMKNGGTPDDFDENAPEKEPDGFEKIRQELNEIKMNLGEPKKVLKPLLHASGSNKIANYSAGMQFPVGDDSSMHVGVGGNSGKAPKEIRAGFQTPIAGGQLRASGAYSPQGKNLQVAYERNFEDGGQVQMGDMYDPLAGPSYEVDPEQSEFYRRLAKKISEATGKEVKHIGTFGGAKDYLANHIVAPIAGGISDMGNMALEGVDYMREAAAKQNKRGYKRESVMGGKMVPPTVEPYASDDPVMGSQQFRDMYAKHGITSGEDQTPITGMIGDVLTNPMGALSTVKAVPKVIKGAKIVATEGLPRATEMGANRLVSDVRRPFTPVDVTVEGVGPDLGQYKPSQFQEYITSQSVGKGTPSPLETLGGRKTVERKGQGVYTNDDKKLETNPMRAFSVKTPDLATDKSLRADIATAGGELNQEAMAAHRFVPMATNQIKDASAMMITGKGGPLTAEQVKEIGSSLPHMIVSHNPRNGGVFIAPYTVNPNSINPEFLEAQRVANEVLGKDAKIQFGKADSEKDLMYMPSSTYVLEGARPPSPAAVAKRQALRRMDRNFVEPARLQGGLGNATASKTNTVD
jgi:hypothetical protein